MQMNNPFSLAYLTVDGVAPVEQIEVAAAAGFDSASLRFLAPGDLVLGYEVVGNKPLIRDIKAAFARTGVKPFDVEVFDLNVNTDMTRFIRAIDAASEVGASVVQVVSGDPDRQRAMDRFAALCDHAASFEMGVAVEFMRWRQLRTIEDAFAFVMEADRPNASLCIDALHLSRSGGTPSAVAAIPAERVSYVQLCDAPAQSPPLEELVREARGNRLYPGEGELRLDELLDALPPGIPIALETPRSIYADRSFKDRAMFGGDALRDYMARYRARRN